MATLYLLVEAAQPAPLLLIADDAHWVDRPTCDVLAFVARRVQFEPVVLVLVVREGIDDPFETAGLPELVIGPLDAASADALLDARAPGLSPTLRDRLLQAAAGNPLALVELPAALGPDWLPGQGLHAGHMPLTARLERAFAARVRELPLRTRKLMLIASANDSGSLAEAHEFLCTDRHTLSRLSRNGPAAVRAHSLRVLVRQGPGRYRGASDICAARLRVSVVKLFGPTDRREFQPRRGVLGFSWALCCG